MIVCGAMERMCVADGICFMSVIGRLDGIEGFWEGELEISESSDGWREVSEMKDRVVELRNVVSSAFVGASWEDARSSMRARECSRKVCLVAMSRSGIWS